VSRKKYAFTTSKKIFRLHFHYSSEKNQTHDIQEIFELYLFKVLRQDAKKVFSVQTAIPAILYSAGDNSDRGHTDNAGHCVGKVVCLLNLMKMQSDQHALGVEAFCP
jgi:hypothetical protein